MAVRTRYRFGAGQVCADRRDEVSAPKIFFDGRIGADVSPRRQNRPMGRILERQGGEEARAGAGDGASRAGQWMAPAWPQEQTIDHEASDRGRLDHASLGKVSFHCRHHSLAIHLRADLGSRKSPRPFARRMPSSLILSVERPRCRL